MPSKLRRWGARLLAFLRPGRGERELAREVASHLQLLEDDFRQRGMGPEEARLAARRAYGGVEQAKELQRAERSFPALEQMLQDIRHAFRSLVKSPAFVLVAVLSLACGIGVNTAVFMLVNGLLLKKLPVSDPERIVQVVGQAQTWTSGAFSFLVFREIQRQSAALSEVVAFSSRSGLLDIDGDPRKIEFQFVTGGFFRLFGARPAIGRLLEEEDDRVERAHRVCVLSYEAWQSRFGGDPRVLGRTVRIDGVPLEIAGVSEPGFIGADLRRRFDAWLPTALAQDLSRIPRESANWVWISIIGRLRPGVSFAEARARLRAATPAIESALPKERANGGQVYDIRDASKGADSWSSELRDPLTILMGAVILVLLVACLNVASLLLARGNQRGREFAIKLALGISRARLSRQLLLETALLAAAGGAAGLLLAQALLRYVLALPGTPSQGQPLLGWPDANVLAFTFTAALLAVLVAGAYPAWQATRTDAGVGLKSGTVSRLRPAVVRRALILMQVSITVVLLFGASLFAHSIRNLRTIQLGYDIQHLLAVQMDERGANRSRAPGLHVSQASDVLARVRQLPGVESAALSQGGALTLSMMMSVISQNETANFVFATPEYFRTMGIPLLRGRNFTLADRKGSQGVAIVNERLANQLWPGRNPIGQHIYGLNDLRDVEIIGVAGNTKYFDIREEPKGIVYQALAQSQIDSLALAIRCRGSFATVEREVRALVRTLAPDYQVSNVTSAERMRDGQMSQDRLLAFLSTLFGLLALGLALVGIYGLLSYSVITRTREVGVRMSVGAQPADVLWLFLREAALLLAGGMLAGLPLALYLARFARTMLYNVAPDDPAGIVSTLGLLALGGLLASLVPARRATRVDPVRALRQE